VNKLHISAINTNNTKLDTDTHRMFFVVVVALCRCPCSPQGLGTSTAQEAMEYFADIDRHRITFTFVEVADMEALDMAYNTKRANARKVWLETVDPSSFLDHKKLARDGYSGRVFVNKELILFSVASNVRAIPSIMDGLKPSQRKILWVAFKRNLRNEIKVAQLAGSVSELSAYHHGEASLNATIIHMAQRYPGSNNMALFRPNGQFGTRLENGKDAASPRYIFTALANIARAAYPVDDDPLLRYLTEEGQSIEPEWFAPCLCMALVNGANGMVCQHKNTRILYFVVFYELCIFSVSTPSQSTSAVNTSNSFTNSVQ